MEELKPLDNNDTDLIDIAISLFGNIVYARQTGEYEFIFDEHDAAQFDYVLFDLEFATKHDCLCESTEKVPYR